MNRNCGLEWVITAILLITLVCMACRVPGIGAGFAGLGVILAGVNVGLTGKTCTPQPPTQQQPGQQPPTQQQDQDPNKSSRFMKARYMPGSSPNTYVQQYNNKNAVANVPGNTYVGPATQDNKYQHNPLPNPARMMMDKANEKYIPQKHEGPCMQCGLFKPNCTCNIACDAAVPGSAIARLPEYPGMTDDRAESIASIVPGLPNCCEGNPKDIIRNQGLYGIKGNLSCEKLKRNAVQDTRFIEPIRARNSWAAYNSYDQLHAKDQFMVPAKSAPEIHHRQYDPLPPANQLM